MAEEFDAKRLALLHYYATRIEGFIIMIYRSDPEKFRDLSLLVQQHIRELKSLAKEQGIVTLGACDTGEVRCSDGLCHPLNDPTCCDADEVME